MSLDHTYAITKKATVASQGSAREKLLAAMLSVINERNDIMAWVRHRHLLGYMRAFLTSLHP